MEIIMKWNKYRLKTTTQATDFVCGLLIDLGINGMEVEDNVQITQEEKEKMYIDYLPDLPEDDGVAYISFYTEDTETENSDSVILDRLREKLKEAGSFLDVGEGSIVKSTTEDIDWVNNWKQYFKSFTVGRFFIKPTWEEDDGSYKDMEMIEIDPGTAFGTGKHDTTQLCIKQLIEYVKKGDSVLDLGCGSGILSIAAKKLGAKKIAMTDIDPAAISAVSDNFAVNHISMEDVEVIHGNVLENKEMQEHFEKEKFDIVVANILADVIIPISAIADRFLKKGGVFISSGIIYMKEDDVISAVNKNNSLELKDVEKQGDWRAVIALKK
jgi:ribosomal protein L11 methyltransferase